MIVILSNYYQTDRSTLRIVETSWQRRILLSLTKSVECVKIQQPGSVSGVIQSENQKLFEMVVINPRTRAGCDWNWGILKCGHYCFNPRTRAGCDTPPPANDGTNVLFQSTHPRGVRLDMVVPVPTLLLFQSTHPRGVRLRMVDKRVPEYPFQSTHPRGVRPRCSWWSN